MGLGENIGYSTLETMNDAGLYVPLTDGSQGSLRHTRFGVDGGFSPYVRKWLPLRHR